MDKSLLFAPTGIRSEEKTLADGNKHKLYFKALTPNQIALFFGAQGRFSDDEPSDIARETHRARFIADALVNEDGTPLLTFIEAQNIPRTLKPELIAMILKGSQEIGEAGKV